MKCGLILSVRQHFYLFLWEKYMGKFGIFPT